MGLGGRSTGGKPPAPTPELDGGGDPSPQDLSAPGTYGPDDPGGGPWIEAYGSRLWYNPERMAPSYGSTVANETIDRPWTDVLNHWHAIELDLDANGHDIESGLLEARTWRWLKLRIDHYASTPGTNLWDALHPKAV